MKNKNLLKVFGIAVLAVIFLTWVIPSTVIGNEGLTTNASLPTGFADIFSVFEILAYYFALPSILILLVGAFYGIINKSGAFKSLVDKLALLDEKKFLIITVVFYMAVTALTGIYLPLFVFIPLSIAVLRKLKYSKVQSVLATAGAATIGLLGQIDNTNISGMIKATTNTYAWIKFGLLVVVGVVILLFIMLAKTKVTDTEVSEEIMFIPEKRDSKRNGKGSIWSAIIPVLLIFVLLILGMYPWSADVTTSFTNAYTAIKGVKIGNFAIFNALLGYFETFGSWTYVSLFALLSFAVILSALLGKLKFSETWDAIISGVKKVAGVALLAALINAILVFTLNSGFAATLMKWILAKDNVALVTLSTLIGNTFMVSELYSAQYIMSMVPAILPETANIELYGMINQFTFGFVSLITPASIMVMITLYYVEEKYTKWFKYIWKLLIAIFVAMLVAILLATLLV